MRRLFSTVLALALIAGSGLAHARDKARHHARHKHGRVIVLDESCPIPRGLPPLWAAGWTPTVGWRYPCGPVMPDFAPANCWRDFPNPTWWGGVELHREFICR